MKKNFDYGALSCPNLKKFLLLLILPFLIIISYSTNASAQQITVSGIIYDAAKNPMTGVNVVIKGTTSGTISDANGRYTIPQADRNSTLVFSFLGFTHQEVPVSGRTNIDIILESEVTGLDEVVVIGYGTVRRSDLTGSVGSINSESLRSNTVTRVEQALLGQIAGVQVKTTTGEPGESPQIRIRGIGSISAGVDPLYVVDGFPIDNIDNLNPNDIETVDILKDASATAIYGSRGANGVIIINTRRGRIGKTSYNLDVYYGLQNALKKPEYMSSVQQAEYFYYSVYFRNIDANRSVSGNPVTDWFYKVPVEVMDFIEGRNTTNTDWHAEILRTSPQRNIQLTASGGTEGIKYIISGEYLDQDGIIINTDYKRYSVRSNLDVQLTKKLLVQLNLNPTFSIKNDNSNTGVGNGPTEAVIAQASGVNPFFPVYNDDGSYFVMNGLPHGGNFYNPVASALEIENIQKSLRALGNMNTEYTFFDGFKARIMMGANFGGTSQNKFFPKLPPLLNNPAYGEDRSSLSYSWLTEYTLNYNKTYGKHSIVGLAGYTSQMANYRSNYLMSDQYPNNLVPTLSAVSDKITRGTSSQGAWSLISYLARLNYNYDSKYYLTASIRTDGSSRFGSENKYGIFPSFALAWRVTGEKFMKNLDFINELKIRTSYGVTGNNNIGDYEQYATISYLNYVFGGASVGGFAQASISNPYLTWEKQKQVNLGLDIGILKSRINLSLDYFSSVNSDLLLDVNIPVINGFSTALQNIGEVGNTGLEFVMRTNNLVGKFEWSTELNMSTYKNEVLQLGPEGDPIYSGANITEIGQPIGMYYGWLTDGIFMNKAELEKGPIFSPGTSVATRMGDVRFVDISGPEGVPDGIINSLDKTIMGSPYPDFYYGMTNKFSYKNFSLIIGIQGSQGNEILNLVRSGSFCRARTKQAAFSTNFWKSEEEPGDGGKYSFRPNDAPTGNVRGDYSQLHVWDGSYLRVNNISLSYLLTGGITQRLNMNSVRVYLNATNPFIFTSYPFWNPDTSTSNNPLQPGRDNNDYPITKIFTLGLNLSF